MAQVPSPAASFSFFQRHPKVWLAVFWAYLLVLVVSYGTSINLADADLWHRFALFDYLSHTGHFPVGDTFSYDPDYQFVPDHEWGGALVFYPTFILGGAAGLILEKLFVLGATLALIVLAGLNRRTPTILEAFFFSLVLLALLPSFLSTLRCGVFTHLFLALWLFWLQRERAGAPIHYAGYFLTMILWSNLHGGYVLGIGWLFFLTAWYFLTGGDWKKRGVAMLICIPATFINPYGWELWLGLWRAIHISRSDFVEWGPVPWIEPYNTFSGYKLLAIWAVVIVVAHVYKQGWKKCDQIAVIVIVPLLLISLHNARHTSLFAAMAGGLLPSLFPPEKSLYDLKERKAQVVRILVRGTLFLLPLVFAIRLLPTNQGLRLTYPPESCPVGAVAYLRDHDVTGNLLVDFNAGSYALWELRGKMRVSMDGRYLLVYSPETFERMKNFFAGGDHWQDSLTQPTPDAVLVKLTDQVYPKMLGEPGWTEVYRDGTQAVFRPKG